ncbi:MAG TPA: Gfo/Idh/MocA family oxidoreductase [Pyrinomonadaceae bacterium]|jgi:predicted dehydrogenase|nr:Gfo/Idh/MocA family oxidoreductase [Pyrinomonadaceae bacterium]
MIRIAIAGCGEHSRASHAAPLARYAAAHPDQIELVAACDLDMDKAVEFCRSFGFVRPYKDLDQMLSVEKPDACVSVMPIEKIVEVGIKLLERCMPCVIEKPLGTSLAEIEKLGQVARDTQTPHMVSVNRRFMPYLNQARSWMSEQGPPRYVRATQVRHQRNEADFIWSTAIHVLDALRYIAGEIVTFDVMQPTALWYVIALRFESGTIGRIEILPTAGMVEESYEFFAEGCRARVTAGAGPQRSLRCWQDGELVIESEATEEQPEDLRNGAYQEVEEFVRALQTGARPQPCIDDILPSARISFAIGELARQRRT